MKKADTVAKTYSYLWNKEKKNNILPDFHHYNKLEEVVPFSVVSGKLGIDAGCGNGYDLRLMALKYPNVKFVGLDLSDGIYNAKKNCEGLKNVHFVQGSLMNLPFKERSFDFAYSYGVIHHTPNPELCFKELYRVLDKESHLIAYLYTKHEKNPFKYYPLRIVATVRILSSRMPKPLLYILCVLLSPLIFLLFGVPAKILYLSKRTKAIADKIPFNFARGPFSLVGDLYDRFGSPMEHRYNREEMEDLFRAGGFSDIGITKLNDTAGWVAWGRMSG